MKRCVIIGGAPIQNLPWVKAHLSDQDCYFFCDGGLYHQKALGVKADLIVGDFDSHPAPKESQTEVISLPCEKDDTDTMYAIKEGLKRGFRSFLLLGVTGARQDHTLANVAGLFYLHCQGSQALLVDDYGEMEFVGEAGVQIPCDFSYFSLLNLYGTAKGVCISGAKYPLNDAQIPCEDPFAVSNQVLPGKLATVTVKEGVLLLIKIKQESF